MTTLVTSVSVHHITNSYYVVSLTMPKPRQLSRKLILEELYESRDEARHIFDALASIDDNDGFLANMTEAYKFVRHEDAKSIADMLEELMKTDTPKLNFKKLSSLVRSSKKEGLYHLMTATFINAMESVPIAAVKSIKGNVIIVQMELIWPGMTENSKPAMHDYDAVVARNVVAKHVDGKPRRTLFTFFIDLDDPSRCELRGFDDNVLATLNGFEPMSIAELNTLIRRFG